MGNFLKDTCFCFFLAVCFLHTCLSSPTCSEIRTPNGNISDSYNVRGFVQYHKCWKIYNPSKRLIYFKFKELNLMNKPVSDANLTISLMDKNLTYGSHGGNVVNEDHSITYWFHGVNGELFSSSSPIVEIHFRVNSGHFPDNYKANFTLRFERGSADTPCSEIRNTSGNISDSYKVAGFAPYHKCWNVRNPAKNLIHFNFTELNVMVTTLADANITIKLYDENKTLTYWSNGRKVLYANNSATYWFQHENRTLFTSAASNIEIHFIVNSALFQYGYKANFTLRFEMDVGVSSYGSILSAAIGWLNKLRSPLSDWRDNSLKAITALYLAGNATFDGTDVNEELLVKRAELRISSSLQRNSISVIDLSSYINFLRITCNSPRRFAFHDLIQQLLDQLESSGNFSHPVAYLALCNANEHWPSRAINDLTNVLNSSSKYLFLKDIQAFALLAISCQLNQANSLNSSETAKLIPLYTSGITNLKRMQLPDGSFGDLYETAVAIQTLISAGDEYSPDWNSRAAIRYLSKELNSWRTDIQALYLSLPVFNGKSLADISRRNCSGNPRYNEDITNEYVGSKIEVPQDRVRYSLFIGDNKEMVRTITFKVPDNFTAHQVMQLAEVHDSKYKFEWRRIAGKMYVNEISQILSDPESGKFWHMFVSTNSRKPPTPYLTKGPDEILLKRGDHLIFWYKTAKL